MARKSPFALPDPIVPADALAADPLAGTLFHGPAPTDSPAKAAKLPRPVTCGGLFATSPNLAAEGCHRLPRHHGEHRATLTIAATRKIARDAAWKARAASGSKASAKATVKRSAKPRLTPAQRKRLAYADIAERMAAGTISPFDAMAEVSALS